MSNPLEAVRHPFEDIKIEDIKINEAFTLNECTFCKGDRVVVFSPITAETLLCEKTILDTLGALIDCNRYQSIEEVRELTPHFFNEILSKLISMRIVLLNK
ncbi:hypothetical protein AB3Y13_06675 [Vibrio alginolyticus]|uniref:hypothetical protein n=1 Tax=Vibrio sp. B1FLJ16 TaxID=2751178 RepID=UPI0015F61DD7|nr:hypothetical protein [Vibrio sp. B1FLJ16]CAD7822629.1 hypothetical protein ACOMICROBIO_EPCKBFOG_04254 [Vibrio sp. B1FLJ16]CAD7824194.1 hypothetical protein ACOMICROBIO_FLGHMIGD_03284 [Vibrio sp. B1FLJ16]CAE6949587.1 hypothetical protein ACOMICROBIO_EPCKBFOG_04254 [Vibrio sp. B1FLJ16]CAE6953881.1 hypothetical protein ACOMICROBIO_FLGHMIGD_03284 [Vibrio sp. B1FLJ16]